MKKILILSAFILLASMGEMVAQNYTINPIPSFNFKMTGSQAIFGELKAYQGTTKEKRDMDVVISTTNHGPVPIVAKVWIVKKTGNVVLGPFFIVPDQLLSVGIDNGQWGVVVKCDWEVYIDVWAE